MKLTSIAFSILGTFAVVAIGIYGHSEYQRTEAAPENIRRGFEAMNVSIERQTRDLRLDSVYKEMDIVQLHREGYGTKITPQELHQYIDDFEWVKTLLPTDGSVPNSEAAQHDLDNDIKWCKRHIPK